VLVVEGEKCRDAAALVLPGQVVVSWCGGGKAAGKTDWSPLAGRSVLVWPDHDRAAYNERNAPMPDLVGTEMPLDQQQGWITGQAVAALAVTAGASAVKVLSLEGLEKPRGWDVADAIQKDWMDRDDLVQFMRSRVRPWEMPADKVSIKQPDRKNLNGSRPSGAESSSAPAILKKNINEIKQLSSAPTNRQHRGNVTSLHGLEIPPTDDLDDYRSNLLTNEEGKLKPKMASNFYWMLRGHPETRRLFAFNDVAQGVFLMRPPPWEAPSATYKPRALSDTDISKAAMWLEARQLAPKKSEARDIIKAVAGHARFNPIRDYLQALRWDGIPRLAGGMWEGETQAHGACEYLGAPPDRIFGTFLTKWHISAVARIMRPGCKADCMLIVEGHQGKMKSTYLRMMATIAGHEYFADGIGDIANKDSIMLMAGCWIVENAEMDGFSRQDLRTIKAWLSRTTDRYIPKFESEPREVPRTFVVSGTHNPSGHGYLKDPTGNRRFWPLPVSSIDLPRVTADKDQIWAEAVARHAAGETWWLSADEEAECDRLTSDRRSVDPWGYQIESVVGMHRTVLLHDVLAKLAIPSAQQNELTVKRVGDYLRGRGFKQGGPDKWERDLQ
jgi:predicted P-loop ATPase